MRCFFTYPNKILQISSVECFLASNLAFIFIFFILSLEYNISLNFSSTLSFLLIHIPTLFFSKNSAFSSSWPGIGFITTIGSPDAKLSVVVSPPGF